LPSPDARTRNRFTIASAARRSCRPTFAKSDIPKFRQHLLEQFCELSGGGCKYTGRDMKSVHEGMHLTESQFNAIVEDLQDAMATQRVPIELQNELIAKLAPLRPDIIHR
jgi:hemoglobin